MTTTSVVVAPIEGIYCPQMQPGSPVGFITHPQTGHVHCMHCSLDLEDAAVERLTVERGGRLHQVLRRGEW